MESLSAKKHCVCASMTGTVQLFSACTWGLSIGSLGLCQHSVGDDYHIANEISLIRRSGFDPSDPT